MTPPARTHRPPLDRLTLGLALGIAPLLVVLSCLSPARADVTLGRALIREVPDYGGVGRLQAPGFVGANASTAAQNSGSDTNPLSTNHWLSSFLWGKGTASAYYNTAQTTQKSCPGPVACAAPGADYEARKLTQQAPVYVIPYALKYVAGGGASASGLVIQTPRPEVVDDAGVDKLPKQRQITALATGGDLALQLFSAADWQGGDTPDVAPDYAQTLAAQDFSATFRLAKDAKPDGPGLNFTVVKGSPLIFCQAQGLGKVRLRSLGTADSSGSDKPQAGEFFGYADPGSSLKCVLATIRQYPASAQSTSGKATGVRRRLNYAVYFKPDEAEVWTPPVDTGSGSPQAPYIEIRPKQAGGSFSFTIACLPNAVAQDNRCDAVSMDQMGGLPAGDGTTPVDVTKQATAVVIDMARKLAPYAMALVTSSQVALAFDQAKGTVAETFTVTSSSSGSGPLLGLLPHQYRDFEVVPISGATSGTASGATAATTSASGATSGSSSKATAGSSSRSTSGSLSGASSGYASSSSGSSAKTTTLAGSGAKDLGVSFFTLRGELKLYAGATFTATYRYPGLLPWLPKPPGLGLPFPVAAAMPLPMLPGQESVANFLNVEKDDMKAWKPPYTDAAGPGGQDAYAMGRRLARAAQMLSLHQDYAVPGGDDLVAALKKTIEFYFTTTESQPTAPAPGEPCCDGVSPKPKKPVHYQAVYDKDARSLVLLPAGVAPNPAMPLAEADRKAASSDDPFPYDARGSATLLNDHHLEYGYFIYAAAMIALWDKPAASPDQQWAGEAGFRKAINELVFDIAYDPDRFQGKAAFAYPKLRMFDPYEGHGWSGLTPGADEAGSAEENVGEALNAWAAIALWGMATGQQDIRDLGICLYTVALHAAETYWFDRFGMYATMGATLPDGTKGPAYADGAGNGAKQPFAARLFQGRVMATSAFGPHPLAGKAVPVLPFGAHSLALGRLGQAYLKAYWEQLSSFSESNGASPWAHFQDPAYGAPFTSVLAKLVALYDPKTARDKIWKWTTATGGKDDQNFRHYTETGDSGAYTLHTIQALDGLGSPQLDYSADQPFYAVFKKGEVATFVGYNPPTAEGPVDIVFTGPQNKTIKAVKPGELRVDPPQADL